MAVKFAVLLEVSSRAAKIKTFATFTGCARREGKSESQRQGVIAGSRAEQLMKAGRKQLCGDKDRGRAVKLIPAKTFQKSIIVFAVHWASRGKGRKGPASFLFCSKQKIPFPGPSQVAKLKRGGDANPMDRDG